MQTRDVASSFDASAVEGFRAMNRTQGLDASQRRRNSYRYRPQGEIAAERFIALPSSVLSTLGELREQHCHLTARRDHRVVAGCQLPIAPPRPRSLCGGRKAVEERMGHERATDI